MKNLILILTLTFLFSGCHNLNRLLNGQEGKEVPSPDLINRPVLSSLPDFGIPTPVGYTLKIYHDFLPLDGVVKIDTNQNSLLFFLFGFSPLIKVFMKHTFVDQWFVLGTNYSDAFWFTTDSTKSIVIYHGKHLENIEYVIYQYIPK